MCAILSRIPHLLLRKIAALPNPTVCSKLAARRKETQRQDSKRFFFRRSSRLTLLLCQNLLPLPVCVHLLGGGRGMYFISNFPPADGGAPVHILVVVYAQACAQGNDDSNNISKVQALSLVSPKSPPLRTTKSPLLLLLPPPRQKFKAGSAEATTTFLVSFVFFRSSCRQQQKQP